MGLGRGLSGEHSPDTGAAPPPPCPQQRTSVQPSAWLTSFQSWAHVTGGELRKQTNTPDQPSNPCSGSPHLQPPTAGNSDEQGSSCPRAGQPRNGLRPCLQKDGRHTGESGTPHGHGCPVCSRTRAIPAPENGLDRRPRCRFIESPLEGLGSGIQETLNRYPS